MSMPSNTSEDIRALISAAVERVARANPRHVLEVDAELALIVRSFPTGVAMTEEELRTEMVRLAIARGVAVATG